MKDYAIKDSCKTLQDYSINKFKAGGFYSLNPIANYIIPYKINDVKPKGEYIVK